MLAGMTAAKQAWQIVNGERDRRILAAAAGQARPDCEAIGLAVGCSGRTVQRVLKASGIARGRGRPRVLADAEKKSAKL